MPLHGCGSGVWALQRRLAWPRCQQIVAVDVKLTRSVDEADCRHLRWLRDQIGDDLLDAVIVTTGPEAYRRADGIAVVPAALLVPLADRQSLRDGDGRHAIDC